MHAYAYSQKYLISYVDTNIKYLQRERERDATFASSTFPSFSEEEPPTTFLGHMKGMANGFVKPCMVMGGGNKSHIHLL